MSAKHHSLQPTVKVDQTNCRFINSYETSLVRCGDEGTSRSLRIRINIDGYLHVSALVTEKCTHFPSKRNHVQPNNSHALATFSHHTTAFQAFFRQSLWGRSGHCWDRACCRTRVRIYVGRIGGWKRRYRRSRFRDARWLLSDCSLLHLEDTLRLTLLVWSVRTGQAEILQLCPGGREDRLVPYSIAEDDQFERQTQLRPKIQSMRGLSVCQGSTIQGPELHPP